MFGRKRIAELEAANANLNNRLQEWEAGWAEAQRKANQITYLVNTIQQIDEQIYKMSQCNNWEEMRPHFNVLEEGMITRKTIESERIGAIVRTEMIKTYCDQTTVPKLESKS